MKIHPTIQLSNLTHLLFSLFLLFSVQSFADVTCGQIEGFEFTNGHESISAKDGSIYAID